MKKNTSYDLLLKQTTNYLKTLTDKQFQKLEKTIETTKNNKANNGFITSIFTLQNWNH